MTPPTLLLTGPTGFLGRRLAPGLAGSWRVVRAGRGLEGPDAVALDLEDPGSIRRAFESVGPAAVVNSGAMADPDACEREPDRAKAVNQHAVRVLADLCAQSRARLVQISTDLVFDGEKGWYSEDDAVNPLMVYGRTKLAAEEAALTRAPGAAVLRVSSLYGRPLGGRPTTTDEMRAKLSRGEPVAAFTDQWRSPTPADQVPEIAGRVLSDGLSGVFHWAGAERLTRHDAALRLCRAFGFDEKLVRAARAAERRFPAARPRDTSLDSSRLASALGIAPLPIADGYAALAAAR